MFLTSADFFPKLMFFKNSFRNTRITSVSNGLDLDQPDILPGSELFSKDISR